MNKRKYILTLIAILVVVTVLVAGGTYAYWTWNSDVTKNVVFNTSKGISEYIVYDEGDSFFIGDFQPKSSFCQSTSTTLSFYKTSEVANIGLTATINMDVNHIDSAVASSSAVHWILTKGDNTISCSSGLSSVDVVATGAFSGITSGNTITLKSDIGITTTEQKFTVWIWIDSSGSNLSSLSGKTIDTNIWTQIDMLDNSLNADSSNTGGPNAPVLDNGMIPVKIANNGTVTTVASTDPTWYNYDNKEWANAVLVKESGTQLRSYYKNNPNITIPESDILAYYVWIPRYKYKIWTTSTGSSPQTIDIEFESRRDPVSSGTTVGSWRTHPAFVFGTEKLSGIWVGKFETTGDGTTPTILPNSVSLTMQNVSTQFATSLKFAGGTQSGSSVSFVGNNTYGLTTSTDSHMMKNSEWGAVAYLSHSQYGVNTQIRINNFKNYDKWGYMTGCGASEENGEETDTCQIVYGGSTSYPQSTTGNISGVFDMSGGAWECVMGNYNDRISAAGFSTMPSSKYYDVYTSEAPLTACNGGICYGHALSETAGWYMDYFKMVDPEGTWFKRGGATNNGVDAGAWIAYYNSGSGNQFNSWRSVLVVR